MIPERFKSKDAFKTRRRFGKFILPPDTKIEYKNLALLEKYITSRGKILSRRISGISAKQQRKMTCAIKQAQFLGLLSVGGSKKRSAF